MEYVPSWKSQMLMLFKICPLGDVIYHYRGTSLVKNMGQFSYFYSLGRKMLPILISFLRILEVRDKKDLL